MVVATRRCEATAGSRLATALGRLVRAVARMATTRRCTGTGSASEAPALLVGCLGDAPIWFPKRLFSNRLKEESFACCSELSVASLVVASGPTTTGETSLLGTRTWSTMARGPFGFTCLSRFSS